MTLSNFDWTDKDSLKWFILLPQGHEGPYSLNQLAQFQLKGKIELNVQVWAEGLPEAVGLKKLLNPPAPSLESIPQRKPSSSEVMTSAPEARIKVVNTQPASLSEDIGPPPLPIEANPSSPHPEVIQRGLTLAPNIFLKSILVLIVAVAVIAGGWFFSIKDHVDIHRRPGMGPELFDRIVSENQFISWKEAIFFREYLANDFSQIWLVTRGFQNCEVEATFTSMPEKLLSMDEQTISFKTKGGLRNHVVEFSAFDFLQGNRILPGMYDMQVRATNCKWSGSAPTVKNAFLDPEKEYQARMKVILFPGSAESFHENLRNLVRKKLEIKEKELSVDQLFWEDLQQKFQTLEAVSLQIEQHFLDFLDENPSQFTSNLLKMVQLYTKNYGSFLTTLVVENEKDFNGLDAKGDSRKRNYELLVRLTAKKIGFDSMTFIEEFQKLNKSPNKKERDNYSDRIRKTFSYLKQDISQKLSQISEDQAQSLSK
jgi:hypothetical protein